MTFVFDSQRRKISLNRQIKSGGEGTIWETSLGKYVAKEYKLPNRERFKKLEVMIANPPDNPTVNQNHDAIAWPKDLLRDEKNNFVGFLMPHIQDGKNLIDIYNPKLRNKAKLGVNWQYLHTTARNLAWIIHVIHQKGYVVGDMKPENILVNDRALVSIVDTDSFQVTDPRDKTVYSCPVGSVGLTPPELIGQNLEDVTQTQAHDHFRLAVIIYLLLFSGQHPFHGNWVGSGEPPQEDELIRRGLWLYSQVRLIEPAPNTIPLDVVHPSLKKLFLKCFNNGHSNPSLRPSAQDWCKALEVAIKDLVACTQQPQNHFYRRTYDQIDNKCYWCDRANNLGRDIFLPQDSFSQPPIPPTPPHVPTSSPPPKKPKYLDNLLFFTIAVTVIAVLYVFYTQKKSPTSPTNSPEPRVSRLLRTPSIRRRSHYLFCFQSQSANGNNPTPQS